MNRRPCVFTAFPLAFLQADPDGPIPYQPVPQREADLVRAGLREYQQQQGITPTDFQIKTEA